jgi:hypothetical protein
VNIKILSIYVCLFLGSSSLSFASQPGLRKRIATTAEKFFEQMHPQLAEHQAKNEPATTAQSMLVRDTYTAIFGNRTQEEICTDCFTCMTQVASCVVMMFDAAKGVPPRYYKQR